MTQAVAHIIDEVGQFSTPERIELRRLIAQGVPMTNDLTDEWPERMNQMLEEAQTYHVDKSGRP